MQLLWIARPTLPQITLETAKTTPSTKIATKRRNEPAAAALAITPPPIDDASAATPAPNWADELQLATKDALAKELAQKRHDSDFSHTFPTAPKALPQFAWDRAATHRVEAIPGGGIAINLSDNCVLLLFPLPLVGCGIGKRPANGDLFKHLNDQ